MPATTAIDSGLARSRPWPMVAAALSVAPSFAGTSPVKASAPTVQSSPRPIGAAAVARASSASCDDRPTNAVLQEVAKSSAKVAESPSAPPSKFLNDLPSTVAVAGQATVSAGVTPAASSAWVLTALKVDPGGYCPVIARFAPVAGRVRHGENGSRRHRDGHQGRVALAAVGAERPRGHDVGQRGVGRLLHRRVERDDQRGAAPPARP